MDCTNTRLLLSFLRAGELDRPERQAVEQHLESCPECASLAQAERQTDDALAAAMGQVPIPVGLKGRILNRLPKGRRPQPWPWIGAAAALLLSAGVGVYLVSRGPVEIIPERLEEISYFDKSPETVKAWFNDLNYAMEYPTPFDSANLDTYGLGEFQGQRVPRMVFFFRGDQNAPAALAHVYVLSNSKFKLPQHNGELAAEDLQDLRIPTTHHTLQFVRYPHIRDFFYLVVYTGNSLDVFLRAPERPRDL